jgi:hypothetical protein
MSNLKIETVSTQEKTNSCILNIVNGDARDVYNIAAPFEYFGRTVLAGRVEHRDSENAEVQLFEETEAGWAPFLQLPEFVGLQDPCVTVIDGKVVLGGVHFPCVFEDGTEGWQMEFFQATEEGQFELLFSGPKKMKDIRLLQLGDGRILVLTRPQGEKGGAGRIGYVVVDSLADVTHKVIDEAPLLEGLCAADEWVGANEAHLLANGKVGVLGHVANFSEDGQRHYYAMSFVLDVETGETTSADVIAQRADFPDGPAKRPDLVDVLFSGGMVRLGEGRARMYVGLSDAQAGSVELPDPFSAYE